MLQKSETAGAALLAVACLMLTVAGCQQRPPSSPPPAATAKTAPVNKSTGSDTGAGYPADDGEIADERALILLGEAIGPGTSRRLSWSTGQAFDGSPNGTPVIVVNGREAGPTLCVTGAVHGDELNGIEMVRRVLSELQPDELRGAVIGIPIVNIEGFRRGSRYLPDRRDLNRFFPGNANGSAAARIAHSLFDNIIRICTGLVDIHTGSLNRTNLPQIRADLRNPKVRDFAGGFGGMVVIHSAGTPGTLRRAATDAGIPAVTLEAGEPGRLQSAKVRVGTDGILRLLNTLGMSSRMTLLDEPRPVYYRSTWVRADNGGILFSLVRLGRLVSVGDVLGTVTDPITGEQNVIYAPVRGRVIGMALNQVVMPGFATFNIGIEASQSPNGGLMAALEPPPGEAPADGRPKTGGDNEEERPE